MTDNQSEATTLTFEQGYARLQNIANRLNEEEVPVSEMCDLFAEGKGLEQALTTFLDQQRARVEDIEAGNGVRVFTIAGTTPAPAAGASPAAASDEIPF